MGSDAIIDKLKQLVKRFPASGKPGYGYVRERRTLNTAASVLQKIADVNFADLSLNLYFMCDDGKAKYDYSDFAEKYVAVLELAKARPERFIQELNSFYMKMAKSIIKNYDYSAFFEFLSFFEEQPLLNGKMNIQDKTTFSVFSAYLDLVLQQTEYLRPDATNINQIICGLDTHGTRLLTIQDPFSDLDLPQYELEYHRLCGHSVTPTLIRQTYEKYGIPGIVSLDMVTGIYSAAQLYNTNVNMMISYIGEETIDMLPQKPLVADMSRYTIPAIKAPIMELVEEPSSPLMHRKHILPSSGLIVKFQESTLFQQIEFREMYKNDAIVVIYKVTTDNGDITGRINTRERTLYSPIMYTNSTMRDVLANTVLWAYISAVCNSDRCQPTLESYLTMLDDKATAVHFIAATASTGEHSNGEGKKRIGDERYGSELSSIAGFIRKLPAGHKASDEAIQTALNLGYELASDETYVKPFVRMSWVVKQKEKVN